MSKFGFLKDKIIIWFLISTFLDTLAFSVISPIRSLYINSMGIDIFSIGILLMSSLIARIILDSPFGTLCDHIPRNKIIIISNFAKIFIFYFYIIADSFGMFLLLFILLGIIDSAYMVSVWSYMSDALKKAKGNYTPISLIWMLPGMFGPYIGGWLGSINNHYTFYLGLILQLAASVFALGIPRLHDGSSSLKDGVEESIKGVYVDELKSFMKSKKNVKISSFITSILYYDGVVYGSFLPIYLNSFFGFSEISIGIVFALINIMAVAVRGIESLYFSKMINKKTIIVMSLFSGILYCLIPFATNLNLFMALMFGSSFLIYFLFPLTYHIFMKSLPRYKRGEVMGVRQTLSDAGGAAGNLVGGWISNSFGVPFAFLSAGILYILGGISSLWIEKTEKPLKKETAAVMVPDGKKIK